MFIAKTRKTLISALALAMLFPASAQAGEQSLVYEVYAGGIHALQAHLDIKTTKDSYDVVLTAKTRGFLGKMAPWEGIFESHGWIEKDGTYKPELHKSTAMWRDEKEIKEYKYTRDGHFVGLTETLDGKAPEDKSNISPELTEGTTDALTGALNVLAQIAKGGECAGSEEIFDGKRRFEQIFKHKGIAILTPTKYNIFKGEASECTIEVKPVAGEWHKKPRGWMSIQEQGRERGTMPTMWASQLKDGNAAVPVKIKVSTSYGVLFMHLAGYKDENRSVVADFHKEE
jgi:hypothetical protein